MKALQIMAPGQAEVIDVPVPEPGPGEVRVEVTACNTCPQWDLHLYHGEPMFVGAALEYPYTIGQPGHEMTGVVDALGSDVTSFKVGDRVAAWRDAGHQRWGCYAEYVNCLEDNLLRVPDGLDWPQVTSLELAMCVSACALILGEMDAVRGRPAAVNGLGPAGLIAAQLLRAEGATSVTAFELSAKRRDEALRHGFVDAALDPTAEETLREYPPGRKPFDVSIDCVGYPNAVRFLMDRTRRHFSLFAVQRHDYVFTPGDYQLILVGYQGHSRPAAEYAMARIAAGELEMRPLATVELPLAAYLEGVKLLERQEATKVCFRP